MDRLLGIGEERHEVFDALCFRDRRMQGREMEWESGFGADRVAAIQCMMPHADNEAEMCQNLHKDLFVCRAVGGDLGKIVDLGIRSDLAEPGLQLKIGGNICVASIVRVHNGLKEDPVRLMDLISVLKERESLEGVFVFVVDEAPGLEVRM